MNTRQKAREAVLKVSLQAGQYPAADAASDVWEEEVARYRDALLTVRSVSSSLAFAAPEMAYLHHRRIEEALAVLDE